MTLRKWFKSGDPWVWLNASAVTICLLLVLGLLGLITVRGMGHFWPKPVQQIAYLQQDGSQLDLLGEIRDSEKVPAERIRGAGFELAEGVVEAERWLLKTGNRDLTGEDFRWVIENNIQRHSKPAAAVVLERTEWGNFYGFLRALKEPDSATESSDLWQDFQHRLDTVRELKEKITRLEKSDIGRVNHRLERLRLQERRLQLEQRLTVEASQDIAQRRQALETEYQALEQQLLALNTQAGTDSATFETVDGITLEIPLRNIVQAYQPNQMGLLGKCFHYLKNFYYFISDDPREANTEGGIFPAIFGTILMVMLMSVFVTPFGVIAAVYLKEYANQGWLTRTIRVAVNNLAGVPSIVYGVFGLGFFVYALGGSLDKLFFAEALPSPTFGTGGLFWASLTLALLTLPVVIVSTEEGLSRIPRSIREGSLALGATKAETLWRTVIPMASPGIMTGLILAVARAAGEVAPLMLVGVVKLAPSLPLDGNYPFLHPERKFMHLGFHIYDVGFQSPNVEAARPLVYATALLLVIVIVLLNLIAIKVRNRLREKYRGLET